jgi:uncharacterized protein (TIGR02466 family)
MALHQIFGTSLVMHDFKGVATLNEALRSKILARREVDPGCRKSNSALTWHSNYDMLEWCEPAIGDLIGMVRIQVVNILANYGAQKGDQVFVSLTPWSMVTEGQGDYATPHCHPRSHFGAVYYVDVGTPDYERSNVAGKLELFDPRSGWGMLAVEGLKWHPRTVIEPKPGRCVLFPSELQHMVHPFFGAGTRIAIAMNAVITKYEKQAAA